MLRISLAKAAVVPFAVLALVLAPQVAEAKHYKGTERNDTLKGKGTNDVFKALGGNDKVTGGGGNDRAYGGDGDDTLVLGAGNDKGYGENDSDQVSGGSPGAGLGVRESSKSLMSSGRSRSAGRVTVRAARLSSSRWMQGPGGGPGVYVTRRDATGGASSSELRALSTW